MIMNHNQEVMFFCGFKLIQVFIKNVNCIKMLKLETKLVKIFLYLIFHNSI